MKPMFASRRYTLRSKFFRLFGGAYTLYDDSGAALGFARMKRFKLREDIRLFADEQRSEPLLAIKTQSVFDLSGAYDVTDAEGQRIGTLKRSGLRSTFVRDTWQVLDAQGNEYAELVEDSVVKSVIRRVFEFVPYLDWLDYFLPQRFDLKRAGAPLAHYQQHLNPLIFKLDVTIAADAPADLDSRVVVAMAIMLAAIEGRQ